MKILCQSAVERVEQQNDVSLTDSVHEQFMDADQFEDADEEEEEEKSDDLVEEGGRESEENPQEMPGFEKHEEEDTKEQEFIASMSDSLKYTDLISWSSAGFMHVFYRSIKKIMEMNEKWFKEAVLVLNFAASYDLLDLQEEELSPKFVMGNKKYGRRSRPFESKDFEELMKLTTENESANHSNHTQAEKVVPELDRVCKRPPLPPKKGKQQKDSQKIIVR